MRPVAIRSKCRPSLTRQVESGRSRRAAELSPASRDGKELFYFSQVMLMSVEVTTSPVFKVAADPKALFPLSGANVAGAIRLQPTPA